MKYFRLQGLFLLTLLVVFLVLSSTFWFLKNREEKQKQLQEFRAILASVARQSADLIEDEEERFPNYEKKLRLIELLHDSWLSSLKNILENPTSSFKKDLKYLNFPFEGASGLFIGRGASLIFEKGQSFKEILGNDWARQTILGVQGGAQAFRLKQMLYLMPVSFEEFISKKNRFNTVFHFGNYLHYYFSEVGHFRFFILLDLKKISATKIREKLREMTLSKYDNLSPHDQNLFIYGDSEITLPGHFPGVCWQSSSQSYWSFLQQRSIWMLLYLGLVILLYKLGGYRLLFLRFESKLLLALLLFMSLLFICFLQIEREIIRSQELLDVKTAKADWIVCSKELERNYPAFKEELGKLIREAAAGKDPFQERKELWKDGLFGLHFQPPDKFDATELAADSFTNLFLLRLSIHLLSTNQYLWDEMQNDPVARSQLDDGLSEAAVITDLIQRKYSISEFEKNIPDWLIKATIDDVSFNRDISGEGKYILGYEKDWVRYKILNLDQFFLAELENLTTGPRLLAATINAPNLFKRYFKEKKFDGGALPADSILIVQMPGKEFFSFPKFPGLVDNFFQEEWTQQRHQNDSLVRAEVNEQKYLGSFHHSEMVEGFKYLILQKEETVKRGSILLQARIAKFHPGFWILGLLVFFWLRRAITKPLERIREGFLKLSLRNFQFQLHQSTSNEAGEMITQFNLMVQKLDEKERMLPYVNSAVMDLLDNLGEKQNHRDRAVMLVSDIRSFTTLCDLHPPEKIVMMLQEYFTLWQEKIEKHNGIIERFIGDAVVAIFLERGNKHFVQSAIQSSLEVHEALQSWNMTRSKEGLFTIRNGVGLSLGEIKYGLVGTSERLELMSLGDPVGCAEQLEALSAGGLRTGIFVDEQIEKIMNSLYDFRQIDPNGEEKPYYELTLGSDDL